MNDSETARDVPTGEGLDRSEVEGVVRRNIQALFKVPRQSDPHLEELK